MPSDEAGFEVLKVDVRGRVHVPREKREQILDEFERSGMSGLGFAAHIGVKYSTFAAWRLRRARSRQPGLPTPSAGTAGSPPSFVQAELPRAATALEVVLPGSVRVVVAERGQITLVAELIRALGSC